MLIGLLLDVDGIKPPLPGPLTRILNYSNQHSDAFVFRFASVNLHGLLTRWKQEILKFVKLKLTIF